jgi:ZIP family zinc transporter
LIEPATREAELFPALTFVLIGAIAFCVLDWVVKDRWEGAKGGGLLVAITLDGIPENLALGVALIGAAPLSVAALAGSILLSNLPEAAAGARQMIKDKRSRGQVFLLWTATAVVLSIAALLGNVLLTDVSSNTLAYIRCVAGGAVVASLATEVFPLAFKEDNYVAGVAAAIGVVLAFLLNSLAQ